MAMPANSINAETAFSMEWSAEKLVLESRHILSLSIEREKLHPMAVWHLQHRHRCELKSARDETDIRCQVQGLGDLFRYKWKEPGDN